MKQKNLIEEKDWDCLVILDACRYDYFENVHGDYLDGKLLKVISEGSATRSWLKRNFEDGEYGDVVYVSANPIINSMGIRVLKDFEFDESKCFHKVIDVWEKRWSDELGTVHPKHVSKATRRAKVRYPGKKIISHFMQPHYPYLSIPLGLQGGLSTYVARVREGKGRSSIEKVRGFIGKVTERLLGLSRVRKLRFQVRKAIGLRKRPNPIQLVAKN